MVHPLNFKSKYQYYQDRKFVARCLTTDRIEYLIKMYENYEDKKYNFEIFVLKKELELRDGKKMDLRLEKEPSWD